MMKQGNLTVLLDFDGVIVDTIEIFAEAVEIAGRALNQPVSCSTDDLRNIKQMSIQEICRSAGVERKRMRAFVSGLNQELLRRADQITMFPDMIEAIPSMSRFGALGIISATPEPVISKVLNNYRLRSCIRWIAGGDMPGAKFIKIKAIMSENHSLPDITCMVGDTISDVEQGKLAGVKTIAVDWGWHDIEWIRTVEPDYEVSTPKQLVETVHSAIFTRPLQHSEIL